MDRLLEGLSLGSPLRDAARAQRAAADVVQRLVLSVEAFLPLEEEGEAYFLPSEEAAALVGYWLLRQEFALVEELLENLAAVSSVEDAKPWLASVVLQAEEFKPLGEGTALVERHRLALLRCFLKLQEEAARPKRWWRREAPEPQSFLFGLLEQLKLLAAEERL